MIPEIIIWVCAGVNVPVAYRTYRQWKTNGDKIVQHDAAVRAAEQHLRFSTELAEENERLQARVDQLTAPDAPWQYIYNAALSVDEADRVSDWLAPKDGSLFSFERVDHRSFEMIGVPVRSSVKFATADRGLAMLFKLTFGGNV